MDTESKGTTGQGASSPDNQVAEATKPPSGAGSASDESEAKGQSPLKPDQSSETTPDRESVSKSQSEEEEKEPKRPPLLEILRDKPKARAFAVIGLGILMVVALMGGLAAWYFGYPWLWQIGFSPLSWAAIPAVFGMLFLLYAPGAAYLPFKWLNQVLQLYVDEQAEAELTRVFRDAQAKQEALEEQLAKEDQAHLVTILQYSQAQLREYYAIGLGQTQRSFRYSVIAMWLGFFILIGGIAIYLFPIEQIGLKAPTAGVNTLVIGSGTIVEFISALFLWVYRRSIKQLTYFYNRQIHAHNVLLSYRISDTMADPDVPKKMIVEHILQRVWSPEDLEATSGKGFLDFVKKS
jgi:hypothetical protein